MATPIPPPVRRARLGISLVFAAHGAVTGTFATRLPWLTAHLHIGPGVLGAALLAPSVGALSTMPFAGRLVHRYRQSVVVRALVSMACLALLLPELSPNVPVLFVALLVYGACTGTGDMAMNAQGVAVEERYGRSIMSSLHGMWSVGGLVFSAFGALAAGVGLDARIHFAIASAVLVTVVLLAGRMLIDAKPPQTADEPPAFALPSRAVLVIGLVGCGAIFAENASGDWSALYLKDITHASPGVAACAYTGFACAMAAGRLIGDQAVRRIGNVGAVRLGGVLGTLGGVLVVLARTPLLGIAGFALIGVGISVVIPLAFAAAGRASNSPAKDIAGVATISYGAGLAAPAIVGGLASATSLTASFAVVAALTSVIIIGARAFRLRAAASSAGSSSAGGAPADAHFDAACQRNPQP